MDIKLPHSLLLEFLDTKEAPETIAKDISLCGPTVDRLHQLEGESVYDIEVITNRIDSASALGIAREVAAILPEFNHEAKLINDPYQNKLEDLGDLPTNHPVQVQILDGSLIPRFTAISLTNIEIKDSPKKVGDWLIHSDQRPINNVVDISNELTLKYGQPVHIFDLDKIASRKMIIRESKKGESILTLDGRTHELKGGDIVIEDGEHNLIDLCGIMGGGLSQVDQNTKNILLFVQTYEPKHIRRTSLYTQERTLASQIFEKSPDSELALPVLIEGVKLLKERAYGEISSALIDIYPNPPQSKSIELDLNWLNNFVGITLEPKQVTRILERLGFTSKTIKEDLLEVSIPSWRLNDINIKEDLAEEITRIYGYFRLPSNLPPTVITHTQTDPLLKNEYKARSYLSTLGFTEIYNIALVSKDQFDLSRLKLEDKLKLQNPLSKEYEYLRTSLIPSLLTDLKNNQGKIKSPIRIFELANSYHSTSKQLPDEVSTLTLVTQGLDYLATKGYLEALASHLHLPLSFGVVKENIEPFITTQTATVYSGKTLLGYLGVIKPEVISNFDLEGSIVITDLNFQKINTQIDPIHHFTLVPQFASIFEDVTITSNKPVNTLIEELKKTEFVIKVTYTNHHEDKYTFRLEFNHPERNLTQEEINTIKAQILNR